MIPIPFQWHALDTQLSLQQIGTMQATKYSTL